MKNGNRLLGLLIIGVDFIAYGLGLIFGYVPAIETIRFVTPMEVGWTFMAVGSALFVSLVAESDKALYSIATLMAAAWATTLTITSRGANGWAAAVSWWCLAFLCILLAGWPDPPSPKEIPPAPNVEELGKS